MSAYVVDKRHIDVLVRAAIAPKRNYQGNFSYYHADERHDVTYTEADAVGQMLWNENVRSVHYRYPNDSLESLPGRIDSPWLTPYKYDAIHTPVATPVEILKALACYEYQSCETPDWEQSAAFAFCEALRRRAIDSLDGYDEAPWDWQDAA